MNGFVVSADLAFRPQFAVLHESIQRFHGDVPILLCTPDEWPPMRNVEVVNFPRWEYSRDCADVIAAGLERYERVMFLGADTELFTPVDEAFAQLDDHDVVVVPHLSEPTTGRHNELQTMSLGFANSDVQLWRQSPVIEWFRNRTRQACEPGQVWYQCQLWLSLIPVLFDRCKFWRTKCYNVAYWNAREYGLRIERDQFVTDGGPLAIYHYSGFVSPNTLSRHMPQPTTGAMFRLYARYADLLYRHGWKP